MEPAARQRWRRACNNCWMIRRWSQSIGRKPPRGLRAEHAAVPVRNGRFDLDAVLRLLATRGINEVQVEAGATVEIGVDEPTRLWLRPRSPVVLNSNR